MLKCLCDVTVASSLTQVLSLTPAVSTIKNNFTLDTGCQGCQWVVIQFVHYLRPHDLIWIWIWILLYQQNFFVKYTHYNHERDAILDDSITLIGVKWYIIWRHLLHFNREDIALCFCCIHHLTPRNTPLTPFDDVKLSRRGMSNLTPMDTRL